MFVHGEALWAAIPVRGSEMEKINLPFFYQLGARLNPLTQLDPYKVTKGQLFIAGIGVKNYVEILLGHYSTLNVCRATGQELVGAIAVVDEKLRAGTSEQWGETVQVTDFEFRKVLSKAKEFETLLSAELAVLTTYHVTKKGAYSTTDLIEEADNMLSESVRGKVPEEALEEIKQAGRCLALDSPTASGFHMMRALEAILHQYYLSVCKPKAHKKLESWGAYLSALKKVAGENDEESAASGVDPKNGDPLVRRVITFLYQIKDTRNDIMHPELVLSTDEAFGLLDVAKAAIIVMADRLSPKG